MTRTGIRRGLTTAQTTWIIVAVIAGVLLLTCIGVGLATGIMLPAIGKARQNAMGMKSVAQLQQIEQAISIAAADPNLTIDSTQNLIDNGLVTPQILSSPLGPVGDDKGDYWIAFDRPDPSEVSAPEKYIVAYDRAMYASEPMVAACLLNGTCETLKVNKFDSLLNDPANADREFNLPKRQLN